MNNKTVFIVLMMGFLMAASNPNDKRIAKRNFREVVTIFTDELDPEKGYKKIEKYNRTGDVIESLEMNLQGQLIQRITYENTPEMEKKLVYSASDSLLLTEFTEFDSRGRKVHYFLLDKRKNKSEELITQYNKWGEKTLEITRKNSKVTQVKNYEYNNLGLIILQTTTDSLGSLISKKTYSYSK